MYKIYKLKYATCHLDTCVEDFFIIKKRISNIIRFIGHDKYCWNLVIPLHLRFNYIFEQSILYISKNSNSKINKLRKIIKFNVKKLRNEFYDDANPMGYYWIYKCHWLVIYSYWLNSS